MISLITKTNSTTRTYYKTLGKKQVRNDMKFFYGSRLVNEWKKLTEQAINDMC